MPRGMTSSLPHAPRTCRRAWLSEALSFPHSVTSPPDPPKPPEALATPARPPPHVAIAPAQHERDSGAVVGAGRVQLGGQPPESGPGPGLVVRRFVGDPGGVLMSPHNGRIDEERLDVAPDGARVPAAEPLGHGIPVPERLGQVAPRRAGARLERTVSMNIRSLRPGGARRRG